MKPDATPRRGTEGVRLFHVQSARGEAVAFARQGHTQEAVVVLVYEDGKPPIERRISCWSDEAYQLHCGLKAMGLLGRRGA